MRFHDEKEQSHFRYQEPASKLIFAQLPFPICQVWMSGLFNRPKNDRFWNKEARGGVFLPLAFKTWFKTHPKNSVLFLARTSEF